MLDFPRWKIWGIVLLCLAGIAFAVPSFFPETQTARWPGFAPTARINLGLDLKGGSHLVESGGQAPARQVSADLDPIRSPIARTAHAHSIFDANLNNRHGCHLS